MNYIDIQHFKNMADLKQPLKIEFCGVKSSVCITKVRVGFGLKCFFLCPSCMQKKEKLYWNGQFFCCASCCGIKTYSGIQNTTKGGDAFIAYKMERFAAKIGLGAFDYPFDYRQHTCPKGKHQDRWQKNLAILQALENMRNQSIFFMKIWDAKTIQSIESGNNAYLKKSLSDLSQYFYDFESGIQRR